MDDPTSSRRLLEEAHQLRSDIAASELIAALEAAGIHSILLEAPVIAR